MKCILGKKLEMTQIWDERGKLIPATVVEVGPCYVTAVRTKEKDGYEAIQIGCGISKKLAKPMAGHLKGLPPLRHLWEFRMDIKDIKRGDTLDVSAFAVGDKVKVTGISKGKGFQGVVKRHGFHGSPATHGHKDQLRMPGSIGATGPQHVFKGTRMAGRMGGERVTLRGLTVLAVDKDKNCMTIKGAVPGARGGLVIIIGNE